MKLHDQTVIRWDFDKLFPGNNNVWADIDYPESKLKPKDKKFCVSSVSISSVRPNRSFHDGARLLSFVIYENNKVKRDDEYGGLYSMNLAQTLEAKGAKREGFFGHGSLDGYWRIEKGELFTDAAIRVGKRIFEIMKIRIEGTPSLSEEELFSLFVVYKITWVQLYGGRSSTRFDDHLRKKHGIPDSRVNLRRMVF